MKNKNNFINILSSFTPIRKVLFIYILSIITVLLMIINFVNLNNNLNSTTNTYVANASKNLSDSVSSKISSLTTSLELLADLLKQTPDSDINKILEENQKKLDFNNLFIVDKDGVSYPDSSSLVNLSKLSSAFEGESNLIYTNKNALIFASPIDNENKIDKVLVGIRDCKNIQDLIVPTTFNDKGTVAIIDSMGNITVAPNQLASKISTTDIFTKDVYQAITTNFDKNKKDIKNGKPKTIHITNSNKISLIISYNNIPANDWTLLTIAPTELISENSNHYVIYNFILAACLIVFFTISIYLILLFWNKQKNNLEKIAYTDPFTSGLNTEGFIKECKQLIKEMIPYSYVIIFLDINKFKLFNQKYGFDNGDNILQHIYKVLVENIKSNELAYRSESDHFFLCLNESDKDVIQARLNNIISQINTFVQNINSASSLKISQGACFIADHNSDINMIQNYARLACKINSKKSNCTYYDSEIMDIIKKEHELNELFEDSIINKDFKMYLQPKVDIDNNTIGGAEALVRWHIPGRGMIFPSDFIPLFEKNEKIITLDLYIFEEVCIFLKDWISQNQKPFPISVNVSRVHFRDKNFLDKFYSIKQKYSIPDNLIELELTESILFDYQEIDIIQKTINQIHDYGFLCSLDDFGSGFSSLGLLKDFSVDGLKMDKIFFDDITSKKSKCIISTLIELAKNLNIYVVAEGIETIEQLDFLKSIKCDMVQGYIYSKPLPVNEFIDWINNLK